MRGVDTAIPQLSIISFDGKAVNQGYGFFTSPNNEMAQRRPRKKEEFSPWSLLISFFSIIPEKEKPFLMPFFDIK